MSDRRLIFFAGLISGLFLAAAGVAYATAYAVAQGTSDEAVG